MSTEIKNTLFRFVSMRVPEALEKDQVNIRFVLHPDLSQSLFLQAIKTIPAGKTKKLVIAERSSSFASQSLTTRESVKALIPANLYDFAVWLSANRTTLTVDSVKKFLPLSPLSADTLRIKLWDNLFYQISTFSSGYVREAIISVLAADFFLKNYTKVVEGNKAWRKLAQARVVIPKELYGISPLATLASQVKGALDKLPPSTRHLDQDANRVVSARRISQLEQTLSELSVAKENYQMQNSRSYKDAQASYQKERQAAFSKADYREQKYTDKQTGLELTYREAVRLELPTFGYEPESELDSAVLRSSLSEESLALVNDIRAASGASTFANVEDLITREVTEEYEQVFPGAVLARRANSSNTNPRESTATQGGRGNTGTRGGGTTTSGSTGSSPTTAASPVFNINSAVTSSSGQTGLILVMDNVPAGVDIIGATYTITFNDATTLTGTNNFSDSWVNGKLQVTLFESTISIKGKTSFTLSGTFTLSNGDTITIAGNGTVTTVRRAFGMMRYHAQGNGTYTYKPLTIKDEGGATVPVTEVASGNLIDYKPSGFGVKRLGISDYRKVEQEVCCYVPGEVSHIENVMAREYKEKSTRSLRRSEITETTSTEQEKEKLSDSTTTDRFEMNREVASVLAEDTSLGVHASFSASWKTPAGSQFGMQAGADFAHNVSKEQSDSQAVTQAKEVTERALERVVQKVREERITKVLEEFEENNKHGFDNREGSQHISGVYRWVDKIYKNKVVNYGKRLMYEFMIPEPAAFHDIALQVKDLELPVAPVDPRIGDGVVQLANHKSITTQNYQHWAGVYNAKVEPKPAASITVGESFSMVFDGTSTDHHEGAAGKGEITIPEGYRSFNATASYTASKDSDTSRYSGVHVTIGSYNSVYSSNNGGISYGETFPMEGYEGKIPVSYTMSNFFHGNVNASVICNLTAEALEKWQIETFNTIISAYEEKLDEYNRKVEDLKAVFVAKSAANPLFYRQIENTVLRKNCITYLADHTNMGGMEMLSGRESIGVNSLYKDEKLEKYAAFVKFFEQAFEWDLIGYNFYPFYWAKQSQWQELYNIENDDSLFRSFLQSGMARVILTVRPGFEETVNWYMATGQIWNGGQVPTLDDPLFLSIVEELKDPEGTVEETWESRVPTSLTVIQAGTIGLDVEGLPCNPECDEYTVKNEQGQIIERLKNPIGQKMYQLGKESEVAGS